MPNALIGVAALLAAIVLWGVLTGRWRAQARTSHRARADASGAPVLIRLPVPWVFVLVFLLGVGAGFVLPFPSLPYSWQTPLRLAAILPLAFGMALMVSALGLFRRHATTTVPFETPRQLVLSGPYRLTRNPMYVGLIAAYLGVAAAQLRLWPVVFLPAVVLYLQRVVIPMEEASLTQAFGDQYREYCHRVRRWL